MKLKTSLTPKDIGSKLNSLKYMIRQSIKNTVNTILVVRVIAVKGEKIDVQTVIKDISNNDEFIDTYKIPSVRYIQWQSGKNSIVMPPKVGDIGLLLISKQDISGLIKEGDSVAQTQSLFNIGDGIYLGGIYGVNEEPTQFISFNDNEVNITGTGNLTINATNVTVNSENINLGGENGLAIARHGDLVKNGNTVVGTIEATSIISKSL